MSCVSGGTFQKYTELKILTIIHRPVFVGCLFVGLFVCGLVCLWVCLSGFSSYSSGPITSTLATQDQHNPNECIAVFLSLSGGLGGRGRDTNSLCKCISYSATFRWERVVQVSTFSSAVSCFELHAVGLCFCFIHVTRVIFICFAYTELAVAYTPPKYRFVSEERVACLEQDRPKVGYSASIQKTPQILRRK